MNMNPDHIAKLMNYWGEIDDFYFSAMVSCEAVMQQLQDPVPR